MTKGSQQRVWIASDIEVTPFRRLIQAGVPADTSVSFFYSFHGEQEVAYFDDVGVLDKATCASAWWTTRDRDPCSRGRS